MGQSFPPLLLPDDKAVLTTVNQNKDAVGYIDEKHIDNRVHILYRLD